MRPFSPWQLSYPGSVGGQTLVGIPALASLRRAHPDRAHVWPFMTGPGRCAADQPDAFVLAEVWPSRFVTSHRPDSVKDAVQVAQTAAVLVAADRCAELGAWFDPPVPVEARRLVEGEEGWILGPAVGTPAGVS